MLGNEGTDCPVTFDSADGMQMTRERNSEEAEGFLMLHNTEWGSVDWMRGIAYNGAGVSPLGDLAISPAGNIAANFPVCVTGNNTGCSAAVGTDQYIGVENATLSTKSHSTQTVTAFTTRLISVLRVQRPVGPVTRSLTWTGMVAEILTKMPTMMGTALMMTWTNSQQTHSNGWIPTTMASGITGTTMTIQMGGLTCWRENAGHRPLGPSFNAS